MTGQMTEMVAKFRVFERAADFARGLRLLGHSPLLVDEADGFAVVWSEEAA
jgi:hypothetical protein